MAYTSAKLACVLVCLGCFALAPVASAKEGWYDTQWKYRRRITVEHHQVRGDTPLLDFPLLVAFKSPDLRPKTAGGMIHDPVSPDVLFTGADGESLLPQRVRTYSPEAGELRAQVWVPSIRPDVDTVLFMYYSGPGLDPATVPSIVYSQPNTIDWVKTLYRNYASPGAFLAIAGRQTYAVSTKKPGIKINPERVKIDRNVKLEGNVMYSE